MSRLHLISPRNYRTSERISAEFEHMVRYINAAERGDKTVGELLAILFDTDGEFAGPIEMRLDTTAGIQFRVGTYDTDDEGWQTIAEMDDIRGAAGSSVGTIEGEVFHNRDDQVATSSQTEFTYSWEEDEDVLVFQNGALLAESAYTLDQENSLVTLDVGATVSDVLTFVTVRSGSVTNYRRSDLTAASGQAVFAFVHDEEETLLVYRNGVLQVPGGANDYTSSHTQDTVTFTSALTEGDVVTVLTVENLALQNVTGLMLESAYTNGSGLIPYSKLSIADGDLPQAKVNGLVAILTNLGKTYVSSSEPSSPTAGDTWFDSSTSPATAYFYDGAEWQLYAPDAEIPAWTSANVLNYLRVNASGTAIEWGTIDLSAYVPKTYMGAADGVASLDSDGRIPVTQLPETFSADTIYHLQSSTVANGTYSMRLIHKEKRRIDAITLKSSAGTATIQIAVDGVGVGSTYAASSGLTSYNLGAAIEVDAQSVAKRIGFIVTSQSSLADLEVALATVTLNV